MEHEKETYIHAKCNKSDKSAWINAAKSQKLKLSDWVIKTLNQSIKKIENKPTKDENKI